MSCLLGGDVVSGVAIGWVYEHSPCKKALFSLHVTIADTVDDNLILYATVKHLAEKARLSVRSVQDGLGALVEFGMLTVEKEATNREPAHYRVELPDEAPKVWITPGKRRGANRAPQASGVQTAPARGAESANRGCKPCTPSHISSNELEGEPSSADSGEATLDLGVDNHRPGIKPRALAHKVFGDVNVARRGAGLTEFVRGEDAVTVTAVFLAAGVTPAALLAAGLRCPTWTKRSVEMSLNLRSPNDPTAMAMANGSYGLPENLRPEPGKSRIMTRDEVRAIALGADDG